MYVVVYQIHSVPLNWTPINRTPVNWTLVNRTPGQPDRTDGVPDKKGFLLLGQKAALTG